MKKIYEYSFPMWGSLCIGREGIVVATNKKQARVLIRENDKGYCPNHIYKLPENKIKLKEINLTKELVVSERYIK